MDLPDFLIGGGRRCGSTSLYHLINSHPDVNLFPNVDTAYFIDDELAGTKKWFDGKIDLQKWETKHSIEAYRRRFKNLDQNKTIGEKTADLLHWIPAHARVKAFIPKGKFIFQLRNPIDRAWSQYWNEYGKKREDLKFHTAILNEAERSEQSDYAKHHLSYVRGGYYDEFLSSFLSYFPREQVLVLIFDDTKANPREAMEKICSFLDLDERLIPNTNSVSSQQNKNWTLVKREFTNYFPFDVLDSYNEKLLLKAYKALQFSDLQSTANKRLFLSRTDLLFKRKASSLKMKPSTRNILTEKYKQHIKNLEEILNRDLSIWK